MWHSSLAKFGTEHGTSIRKDEPSMENAVRYASPEDVETPSEDAIGTALPVFM